MLAYSYVYVLVLVFNIWSRQTIPVSKPQREQIKTRHIMDVHVPFMLFLIIIDNSNTPTHICMYCFFS